MSILLKNLRLETGNSSADGKKSNILIDDGIITSLSGESATRTFEMDGCFASAGWMDLNASFNDPGDEVHEDLASGSAAAIMGGFTDVQVSPQTIPPVDTKSTISYILKHASPGLDLHPMGAISVGLRCEGLTEILDLYDAGVRSFSNGDQPIWNAELLLKALQYTKDIDTPIFQNARDLNLAKDAHMHEGITSTRLGLKGEPSLSEYLSMRRDIEILKYSGGRLHFSCVSTEEGVHLVEEAKQEGLNVTADVGIHHLLFTDESLSDFDTNYKVLPPYRSEGDRHALIDGVKSGVIDAITSNHRPFASEFKQMEIDLASHGNISLQTFYPAMLLLSKEVAMDVLLERIIKGPRKILGLKTPEIAVGSRAKLTIFNPNKSWTFDSNSNQSKSVNSPFWGEKMTGKVMGTVNRDFISIKE